MQPETRYKEGDQIGGRYLVHQALMGGMGEVYLCLDLEQDLPYALKTFQARFLTNKRLRKAFESEVATWVALEKHSNIVRCFYLETIENQPFMFLEWVSSDESHGTDLRSRLRRGPLDLRLALDFAIDVCRGLIHAALKQPGIVHCDLKPENILVAQGRVAKITDFGLAKIARDANLALPGVVSESGGRLHLSNQGGTPPYMAPEQWLGLELDGRTDIYALGCILYEMLAGSRAFTGSSLEGLRRQHLGSAIPFLTHIGTLLRGLDKLVASCLAKQKEDRFSSVAALLEELSVLYQERFARLPTSMPVCGEFTVVDYCNRGSTYRKLGRHEAALADHDHAVRLNPDDALPYLNRGVTYKSLGRFEESLADYSYAVRLDPNCWAAYFSRGNAYARLGRHEEALADYSYALRLKPEDVQVHSNRANSFSALGRHEEALADYSEALRLDPCNADVHANIGVEHAKRGELPLALHFFERAAVLGDAEAAEYAERVREMLGLPSAPETDLPADIWETFLRSNSIDAVRRAVTQHPILLESEFIDQAIEQGVPQDLQPALEQRLAWLRQIANEQ